MLEAGADADVVDVQLVEPMPIVRKQLREVGERPRRARGETCARDTHGQREPSAGLDDRLGCRLLGLDPLGADDRRQQVDGLVPGLLAEFDAPRAGQAGQV